MLRHILINKWILSSIVLMIIVAVSCYFWYQHETSLYKKEIAKTNELVREMELTNKADTDNLMEDETKTSINDISLSKGEVSDADIEKLIKEVAAEGKISDADKENLLNKVAAEEEDAKETLSAEEMVKRENQRKSKELWEKIGKIIQDAGGSIHTATHPEEIQKVVDLIEEASEGTTVFTQMHNFGLMFQNSVNSKGEMPTSEVKKMADYYETELGNTYIATMIRNMAQYATLKGYEVVNINEIMNAGDFESVLKAHYESTK